MSLIHFHLFILFYISFFVICEELIVENPIKISQSNYSLVFLNSDKSSYNIITERKIFILEKTERTEKNKIDFNLNLQSAAIIKDESNYYYLISGNNHYLLYFNSNHEIERISEVREIFSGQDNFNFNINMGIDFFGFIVEKNKNPETNIKSFKRVNI